MRKIFETEYRIKRVITNIDDTEYYPQYKPWYSPFWLACDVRYESMGFDVITFANSYRTFQEAEDAIIRKRMILTPKQVDYFYITHFEE